MSEPEWDQFEEDFSEFRFMLTDERREQGLLRRRRSSMETDEQFLTNIKKKNPSLNDECEEFLIKKGFIRSPEGVTVKSEEGLGRRHTDSINEMNDICGRLFQIDDQKKPEEEEESSSPSNSGWNADNSDSDEKSSEERPSKFFVQQKPDATKLMCKPPIYRNINIVFEFKSRLKKGNYTLVNRYYSRVRKIDVAIKIIPKIGMPERRMFKFLPREYDLAQNKTFHHPNIVRIMETYEVGLRIYFMMEYVDNGNLTEFITARGRLDPVTYRSFFGQLISAVDYCLENGICHRKLSSDNCLITSDFVLKLCDFSYCRPINDRAELLDTFCGVLGFTAPEILMCRDYKPNLSESWSCGVILFTMIYGAMPFDSSNFAKLLKQVLKPIKYQWYCDTPFDAIMLMYQSISPVGRRWSIRRILGHRWITPTSTKGYANYMKWYKKRTRGPSVPVVRRKLFELMELIKNDYVTPLNEKHEKMYQRNREEHSEQEILAAKSLKNRKNYEQCRYENFIQNKMT